MIIKINNTEEKSMVLQLYNIIENTSYPTRFFVDIPGYLSVNNVSFVHFTSLKKALHYDNANIQIMSFIEFVMYAIKRILCDKDYLKRKYDDLQEEFFKVKLQELRLQEQLKTVKQITQTFKLV